MRTLAFATFDQEPTLVEDDRRVEPLLKARGIRLIPWVWDRDPMPKDLAGVVVRSCWDYHIKTAAWRRWLDALDAQPIPVANPSDVLRWNLDKHYLRELEARGAILPQTCFVSQGDPRPLEQILEEQGLDHAVVKPTISLSAHQTWRTDRQLAPSQAQAFAQLVQARDVMVQAFVPEVLTSGELSMIFLGGQYSHTIQKVPKAGDFRVQGDFGASRLRIEPSPHLLDQARAILQAVPKPLLYARVDGIPVDGQFVLMELELIDPYLFLEFDEAAPPRLADAICAWLGA